MKALLAVKMTDLPASVTESFIHRPDLISVDSSLDAANQVTEREKRLQKTITETQPEVLVVGNNHVGSKTMDIFKENGGTHIIRMGASLAAIDTAHASQIGIMVENTPGINAPSVSQYMLDESGLLKAHDKTKKICVLGTGKIGLRVASTLAADGYMVTIYSPNAAKKNLPNFTIAANATQAVKDADYIFSAIDASNGTGAINEDTANIIKLGAALISVSDNKVYTHAALRTILAKCTGTYDSLKPDIAEIQQLGIKTRLKLASNAMNTTPCQMAMNQAVYTRIAGYEIEQLTKKILTGELPAQQKARSIAIIGSGFEGLAQALMIKMLNQDATITIHDRIYDPRYIKQDDRSTTFDGRNARMASITETTPHAVTSRTGILTGKWYALNGNPNSFEQKWMAAFEHLANFPEMNSILTNFAAILNASGLDLWRHIFTKYPEVLEGVFKSERIIRLYKAADFETGKTTQEKHSGAVKPRELGQTELEHRLNGVNLENMKGIEVDGFAINAQTLATNLMNLLRDEFQVQFKWQSTISRITRQNRFTLHSDNGEAYQADEVIVTIGSGKSPLLHSAKSEGLVQGVAGCWLTLPNITHIQEGFKIHSEEPNGVINVTISPDGHQLYFSGGYAYVGTNRPPKDYPLMKTFFDNLEAAAQKYLPEQYSIATVAHNLEHEFCIRPMSPDGIPIIETMDNGKKFIGGTNAGGFTLSPILGVLTSSADRLNFVEMATRPERFTLTHA